MADKSGNSDLPAKPPVKLKRPPPLVEAKNVNDWIGQARHSVAEAREILKPISKLPKKADRSA